MIYVTYQIFWKTLGGKNIEIKDTVDDLHRGKHVTLVVFDIFWDRQLKVLSNTKYTIKL